MRFEDLFDHVGTFDVRYGAAARELSGRDVVIEGYLAHTHGPHRPLSLVDQQGVCPDCSPVAAISLLGAIAPMRAGDDGPVRVRGRLDFGFRLDDGIAVDAPYRKRSRAAGDDVKQLIHGGRVLTAGRLGGEHADVLIDGDTIVAVLPPGESVSDDVSAGSTPATGCSSPGSSTPTPTPRCISPRPWPTAGRSSFCSMRIPGPRAGARSNTSISPPSSARWRWCARAAPPATTSSPRSRRRRSRASTPSRAPTTTSACAR